MPQIPYEADNFPSHVPKRGLLAVPLPMLLWGAVTVGAAPTIAAAPRRPLLEVAWRALMAAASLHPQRGHWHKTSSYSRLDASEKSAVSYFLGMLQAKVTCAGVLGVPHLVHLDACLALNGTPTRRSRPDLIGFDIATSSWSVAVEAKGRTHGWHHDVVDKAKKQATLLSGVTGTSTTAEIASVAWFDRAGAWNAHLTDPTRRRVADSGYPPESVLAAYYGPLAHAIANAQELQGQIRPSDLSGRGGDLALTGAVIPGTDLVVALPLDIFRALTPWTDTPTGRARVDAGRGAGEAPLVALARGVHDIVLEQRRERASVDGEAQTFHLGFDGVLVGTLGRDAVP